MEVSKISISSGGKTIPVNRSAKGKSVRMVHNGKTVLSVFESTGFTETKNQLFIGETFFDCETEASAIGLEGYQEAYSKNAPKERLSRDARRNP